MKSIIALLEGCPDSVSILEDLLVAVPGVKSLRRVQLSLSQLSLIVYVFSRHVHNPSLPLSVQTSCVQVLLDLVDTILSRGNGKEEGQALLGRILEACVSKFGTLKRMMPQLLEGGEGEDGKKRPSLRTRSELLVLSVSNLPVASEHLKEVCDCKELIKTLVTGMKTLVLSITRFNATQQLQAAQPQGGPSLGGPKGLRENEVKLASGILRNGVYCLALFKEKEEEDIFTRYCSVFEVMEHRILMDMFSLCMPHLFESMMGNNQLLQIFSKLLQTEKVTRHLADVLVNFLVNSKLDVLKQPDLPAAKLVLQLFQYLFVALYKFPVGHEQILQPHVLTLMEGCMKYSTEVEKPVGYMQLLRIMFRYGCGEKFRLLYVEFLSTLEPCLNMLLDMAEGPTGSDMTDLVVELCLTMPAELSSLSPHLPRLMKPLLLALKGSEELMTLGLKTLEFWIENVKPEYLEPCMAKIMSELIQILWSHLRPKPHAFGSKCLQLLGKLGGRNRRFLRDPLVLDCKENPEHGLQLILMFEQTAPFVVPLDHCIFLARTAVMGTQRGVDAFSRKHALKFLRVCLISVLNIKGNLGSEGVTAGQLTTLFLTSDDASRQRAQTSNMEVDNGVKTKTQLMAERSVFMVLLATVIAANAESELREPQDDFVLNVCRHFAMIFHVDSSSNNQPVGTRELGGGAAGGSSGLANASAQSHSQANLKELDPLIFLDALVGVLADDNRAHAKAALDGLNVFAETLVLRARSRHTGVQSPRAVSTPGNLMMVSSPSTNPLCSPPPGLRIPVFELLLPRLLHCCYGSTWQSQMGGVMGLGALVGKAAVDTLCLFQVQSVRALVYVLKRLPQHANREQEETSQVLTQVLRVVNNVDETNSEGRRQSFEGVVDVLAAELFNPNVTHVVRKNVQSCLALLASRTGSEVSVLLEPFCQELLHPLITRPLKSKLADQQVSTVMALIYSLELTPPILALSPKFTSVLHEALEIAEADEGKLSAVSLKLLSKTMALPDFKAQRHPELCSQIVTMLLKSWSCKTPEMVAVGMEGLRQVLQQQEVPKELLNPVLPDLAHHTLLTMPLLQGLAQLLAVLSNLCDVTLGEQLMEHLRKRLEPDKLIASHKSWKASEDSKITAAIIELFHLLPSAAGKFLDPLVLVTIRLEEALPQGQVYSELISPYHVPLTKFLNRYATEAVDYFLARMTQPAHFTRFMHMIRSETGHILREELAQSSGKIISSAFSHAQISPLPEEAASTKGLPTAMAAGSGGLMGLPIGGASTLQTPEIQFHGVALLSKMVKLMPERLWMTSPVVEALVRLWRSSARTVRIRNEESLSLNQVKESKRLVKCFVYYLRHHKNEVDLLFEMLSIFLVPSCIDYTFLKEFLTIEVAEGYSPQEKEAVLARFLSLLETRTPNQDLLVVSMRMLVRPMLSHSFQNNQHGHIVDASIIKTIVEQLLGPQKEKEVIAEYDDLLQVELIQVVTLLVRFLPTETVQYQVDLRRCGRKLLLGESVSKHWGSVLYCQCLGPEASHFASDKELAQVFNFLMQAGQQDNKVLVKEALGNLMPVLLQHFPLATPQVPRWILYMEKFLGEVVQSVPQVVHTFQLLIDLAGLVLSWEKRNQAELSPATAMGEKVIVLLIQVALVIETRDREMSELYSQALDLLSQALEVWSNANTKFLYLEELPSGLPDSQHRHPSQGLDVLHRILEKRPHVFIRNNVRQIMNVLEPFLSDKLVSQPAFTSKVPDAGVSLCSLLKMVFDAFPVDSAPTLEMQELHAKVEKLIHRSLGAASSPQLAIGFTLPIVETLSLYNKVYVDRLMVPLLGVLHRLAREMVTVLGVVAAARQASSLDRESATTAEFSIIVTELKAVLKASSSRVLHMAHYRENFKQEISAILGEKGADASVLLVILDIVKDWVVNDFKGSETATATEVLNIKEVVSLLQLLSQVDRRSMSPPLLEEWEGKYLELLYPLCSDCSKYSSLVRQEIFQKVECLYMLGLRARDPEMRQKFLTHYHDSIPKTLFARLQFIIQTQDWEALSDRFWLKEALDLVLAIQVENWPITFASNSAQVPSLMVSGGVPEYLDMVQPMSESGEEPDGAPPTFDGMVKKHAKFLNEFSQLQVADLVSPLCELAHTDAHVAYHMWVLVFPLVWGTLQKDKQDMLAEPMISLLKKAYHSKQVDKRPNVVQALLEGLYLSQSQSQIPSDLIKFLGRTYNAWHIAISLLERNMVVLPQETCYFDDLAELYRMLNEDDVRYGLWNRRLITAETRAGLALVQHGFWEQAQEMFYQAMRNNSTEGSESERLLWQEQWISCALHLNQWEPVVEFACRSGNYDLQLDCLWKNSDWVSLKETDLEAQVEESPKLRMVQAYVALNEATTMTGVNMVTEANMRVSEGIESALHQWWQLPEMAVQSHVPLLQQFQQLVELQESARVLEISNGYRKHTPGPQQLGQVQGPGEVSVVLKGIFETWLSRTPNGWDDLTVWNDLLLWRNHLCKTAITAFQNPSDTYLGYSCMAWSVDKLASVARKQGLYQVCLDVLSTMYGLIRTEGLEHSGKLKEQAKAYLQMKGELVNGMNLINSTNLESFPVRYRAEIICLKGKLYQMLSDYDNANKAFFESTTLLKSLAQGWISWGNLCDRIYKDGDDNWLEYALICLFRGVMYGSKHGRSHLARVLYYLSFHNETGAVGKALDQYGGDMPLWVWLTWIPQLLLSLQRPEVSSCKNILLKLAAEFPQALYYWLRSYGAGGEDIMECLRIKHSNLATELEVMVTEMGARFRPLPEERLLGVVHGLLHESYKCPTATGAEVPLSLKKDLSGVCKAFFSTTESTHVDLVNEYKAGFERDLDPDSTGTFPATLAELTGRLKHWKGLLQSNVEDRLPAVLKLEEETRQLQELHVLDIEVPGQYFNNKEVAPDHTVKLDRFGADVPIVRRHGSSHRRLTMIGSDGSQRHFLVQTSLPPRAPSDERMVQLLQVLNCLLEKHKESRRRHLAFSTPIIIPFLPSVRLVEDDLMYSTLEEVYEINCARYGQEADSHISHFKEKLNKVLSPQCSTDAIAELRLHTYNEITEQFVPENVFSQFMYKLLPTHNHIWAFKKQFVVQLALSGFMSYILQIGGRSPKKILFAKNTGKVFQDRFYPAYDMDGIVEFSEPVPFRLTRNLQAFLTPCGVEGLFVSSMCAAAQAMISTKNQHMQQQLAMFFRDELISWSWHAHGGGAITSVELKEKVSVNVEQVKTRIKFIAPECFQEEDDISTKPPESVQRAVIELVEAASEARSLCMMDPTWLPWF